VRDEQAAFSVDATVFGEMIAATTLNMLFVPVLYVIVRSLVPGREAVKAMSHTD
jgi:multidrug efflux pump subunit AcrB